ncbi:MAG TPA: hypothetical protein VKA21_00325 [Candidatus Binatia bacterium]|nr:hypothetical protein [Candidatus Binatia bacterium]
MSDGAPIFRLTVVSERRHVERAGPLTPYAVELILDDARRAAPGARLEIALSSNADDTCLAAASRELERLAARGVYVRVRRDPALDGARAVIAAA